MPTSTIFDAAHTSALFNDLQRANTEAAKKERFIQYLTKTFAHDTGAQQLISAMTLGAERVIANIPRGAALGRGRADTQTETVIIEWEKDLTKTGEHAKDQLTEYLQGNWRSGQEYRFVLLTTDGLRWRRYAPDWSKVEMGKLSFDSSFTLREVRQFDLTPENFSDFPFFLDEVLFANQQRAATLERVSADFGDTSTVFINSIATLQALTEDLETQSELKVAYEQWRKFLSIAYGTFDDSPNMFLVHTYLSVFAKFISYAVVAKSAIRGSNTERQILSGVIFQRLNIERFVEDDFFHWVNNEIYYVRLKPMFRELIRRIEEYDFSEVREDILKGVYQELIDLETRHALGEYYTPDWLCERIVSEIKLNEDSRVLDPACGSGSFLRAAVSQLRRSYPKLGAASIAEQVVGIDIHPLSVLISKATMLLALGPTVKEARKPVTLHIYLANSLLVPRGTADLFKSTFQVSVDNSSYTLDIATIENPEEFDTLVTFCDDMVNQHGAALDRAKFIALCRPFLPKIASETVSSQLFEIYRGMKTASQNGRDSIWKFILQNSYKPVFLMGRFDYVVGNPPWLTYAGVSNGQYQKLLRTLSDSYAVTPVNRANLPHLEIAAIFMAHSVNYFLKPGGTLSFVLPRSFMSADQHENTRRGMIQGLRLSGAWDLEGVSPLFRVPACVLFAIKGDADAKDNVIPPSGIPGQRVAGRLSRAQIHWDSAAKSLTFNKVRYHYSRLIGSRKRSRSALTETKMGALSGSNAYQSGFTQGATLVPRNFLFVSSIEENGDSSKASGDDMHDRVNMLRTSDAAEREAKAPWKGNIIEGRAEGAHLFRTAISKNVLPFALVNPPLVVLPITIDPVGQKDRRVHMKDAAGLTALGHRYASQWFSKVEKLWDDLRTELNRSDSTSLSDYLNWQGKLTNQNPNARYLVLYTSSATDASSVVVDLRKFDLPFIVDHKTYWCEMKTEEEAHYVCAYINSGYANRKIKDFQSRGLFGPRDIHKTIVKLPFPKFKLGDAEHVALAELGKVCAKLAKTFLALSNADDLKARALGRLRAKVRDHLANQLEQIDVIVEVLSSGKSRAVVESEFRRQKKRRSTQSETLFD